MSDFPIPASIELISQEMINEFSDFQNLQAGSTSAGSGISPVGKPIFPLAVPNELDILGPLCSLSNLDAVASYFDLHLLDQMDQHRHNHYYSHRDPCSSCRVLYSLRFCRGLHCLRKSQSRHPLRQPQGCHRLQ